jgi:hypothetical protein
MVKKFTASRKQLKPDTRFNSLLISKFVNCLMYDGKKSVAPGRSIAPWKLFRSSCQTKIHWMSLSLLWTT